MKDKMNLTQLCEGGFYTALREELKGKVNLGEYKMNTRKNFIMNDDVDGLQVMYEWEQLNKGMKNQFYDYILKYDAINCFIWVQQFGHIPLFTMDKPLETFSRTIKDSTPANNTWKAMSLNPKPKICTYLTTEENKDKALWLYDKICTKVRCMSAFQDYFIRAYELLKIPIKYNDVLLHHGNRLVKWLLDRCDPPSKIHIEHITRIFELDNIRMKLMCDHSEKVWKLWKHNYQYEIDPERVKKDDYYQILTFPLHKYALPIYLTYDLLKKKYPDNVWLDNKSVIKLIEIIRNYAIQKM